MSVLLRSIVGKPGSPSVSSVGSVSSILPPLPLFPYPRFHSRRLFRVTGALLRVIRNKYLWLATSLLVYTFGISGGVYDIIRNPAPFMIKQDASIIWFHPQVRTVFNSSESCCFLAMHGYPPQVYCGVVCKSTVVLSEDKGTWCPAQPG